MTKRLEELAALLPGARIVGDAQTEITSIERDSRRARVHSLPALSARMLTHTVSYRMWRGQEPALF